MAAPALLLSAHTAHADVGFDSGPVRPVAMSPDGKRLFVVNTPNGTLEIFDIGWTGGLTLASRVPVGLDPVAVAVRNDGEVWVVNHVSDSVSVVTLSGVPRVTRTLLVGDEPRDIVFAGRNQRAFITTAHRGQHRSHPSLANVPGAGDPQLTTAGVGRSDVWVFDPNALGSSVGGTPVKIMNFFSDTPRALAVSPDKATVYVAAFKSGNQTTVVPPDYICPDFATAPCVREGVTVPGGLPGPSTNYEGKRAPETSLIVKYDNASKKWLDVLGRDWSMAVGFDMPDLDVFAVDANQLTQKTATAHVGTTLFNMVANPVNGKLYVSNNESMNHIRFEGSGTYGGSTVQGQIAKTRITVVQGTTATPRHLNKHIDYTKLAGQTGFDATAKNHSLSTPLDMVVTRDGKTLYVAAFGSSKIGVFDTASLESDTFNPRVQSQRYITVSGGGPSGLVLDDAGKKLYVTTRFDNAVKVIDLAQGKQIAALSMPTPETAAVVQGRPMLYDADLTSGNGESACSACHTFGGKDELAWDLGDPNGRVEKSPIPSNLNAVVGAFTFRIKNLNGTGTVDDFHPMKGPMVTQTLAGLTNSGAMHWRGDRSNGFFGVDGYIGSPDNTLKRAAYGDNEVHNFKNFVVALGGLLGKPTPPTGPTAADVAIMDKFTAFQLQVQLPPNPVRALDNSLTPAQQRGRDTYFGPKNPDGTVRPFDGLPGLQAQSDASGGGKTSFTCEGCHQINAATGRFGTQGESNFEGERQILKVPQLRDLYTKVGMFGSKELSHVRIPGAPHQGQQIRGFGFTHDGAFDTLFRFTNLFQFNDPKIQFERLHKGTPTEPTAMAYMASSFGKMGFPYDDALAASMQRDMEQFMLAIDTDLAPIVGQQVTFSLNNAVAAGPRIDLLKARAAAPFTSKILGGAVRECDLVARSSLGNLRTSYVYQPATDKFKDALGISLSDAALRVAALAAGREITYTCAVPGTGTRVAFGS
jgi:DNA-binding beta-propeller fold protein YncE